MLLIEIIMIITHPAISPSLAPPLKEGNLNDYSKFYVHRSLNIDYLFLKIIYTRLQMRKAFPLPL